MYWRDMKIGTLIIPRASADILGCYLLVSIDVVEHVAHPGLQRWLASDGRYIVTHPGAVAMDDNEFIIYE
jgi:hypothetical protein